MGHVREREVGNNASTGLPSNPLYQPRRQEPRSVVAGPKRRV